MPGSRRRMTARAALGFTLIWLGTFVSPVGLCIGLALFAAAMLLGPASRYLGRPG